MLLSLSLANKKRNGTQRGWGNHRFVRFCLCLPRTKFSGVVLVSRMTGAEIGRGGERE